MYWKQNTITYNVCMQPINTIRQRKRFDKTFNIYIRVISLYATIIKLVNCEKMSRSHQLLLKAENICVSTYDIAVHCYKQKKLSTATQAEPQKAITVFRRQFNNHICS